MEVMTNKEVNRVKGKDLAFSFTRQFLHSPWEDILAEHLREKRIPFTGPNVDIKGDSNIWTVDFFIPPRLIIEVNGKQHRETLGWDEGRKRDLEASGYKVLAFPDFYTWKYPETMMQRIEEALEEE
jgi:very-short-patch-repair endonuclease